MALSLKSSGGGSVTIADPASTASNFTLNPPLQNGTLVATDANGNVGIGTSSPVTKLTVAGSFAFSGNQALNWNTYSNSGDKYIANGYAAQFYFDPSAGMLRYLNASNNVSGAGAAASLVDRLAIDSSGNLLVGTTSVGGQGGFSVSPNASAGSFQISVDRASTTSNSAPFLFKNGGTQVGYIQYSNTSTTYGTSSDYRLKENIEPMIGALEKVKALKPVTYTWKEWGTSGQGFIAHELQAVVPDCVTGEKDAVDADGNPIYQGIDTSFLVATLTAAIQEQQAIIADLKTRIETLEAK